MCAEMERASPNSERLVITAVRTVLALPDSFARPRRGYAKRIHRCAVMVSALVVKTSRPAQRTARCVAMASVPAARTSRPVQRIARYVVTVIARGMRT